MIEDKNEHQADSSDQAPARRRRGGRPSKMTPDVVARILSGVRCGASYAEACAAAGISASTLAHWKRRAKAPDAPRKLRRFMRKLEQARHEGHIARLATIQKASQTDWRAAAWLTERLSPERFSTKHQIQHSGRIDAPTDRRAIAAILAVPGLLDQLDVIALSDETDELDTPRLGAGDHPEAEDD
jgi:hypothetical protein